MNMVKIALKINIYGKREIIMTSHVITRESEFYTVYVLFIMG
jgi:hypothetical protein